MTDLRPVAMSELAPLIGPVRVDPPEDCPVCGAPNGTCTDVLPVEDEGPGGQQSVVVEHENSLVRAEASRAGLGWRSKFRLKASSRGVEFGLDDVEEAVGMVGGVAVRTVRCDVYEELWAPGASSPLFVLRLRAGDALPEVEVMRMVGRSDR